MECGHGRFKLLLITITHVLKFDLVACFLDVLVRPVLRRGWQVLPAATRMLRATRVLTCPRRLLEHDEDTPLEEQSTYRLLCTLFGSGWKLKLLGHKEVAENIPVSAGPIPDSDKHICIRRKSLDKPISQPYLVCLCMLADAGFRRWLRGQDIGFLRHGQTDKAYKQIIQKDETSAMAFELDVGSANLRHRQHGGPLLPGTKGKFRVAESFTWGCVSFKYHKPSKRKVNVEGAGGIQCDCPRKSHVRTSKAGTRLGCTFSGSYDNEEEKAVLIHRMKVWIVQGLSAECNTYTKHAKLKKDLLQTEPDDLPNLDALSAPPRDRPETDDEAVVLRAARPKKKAKAKPAHKAKAAAARARAASASASNGSDGPNSQTSTSSTSSSGSSSDDSDSDSSSSKSCSASHASESD